jgi:Zn-dependent peptidase ImmA (M78 family)
MTKANTMSPLYAKLKESGFSRPFVKGLLPAWWDDALANTPAGYQEAALILGKLFNIRPSSLLDASAAPEFRFGARRFKRNACANVIELDPACALAMTAAKLALSAMPLQYVKPASAAELRRSLLSDPERRWIDFSTLLEACWQSGIPVLHLDHLPNNAKKMDGLAISIGGRPVIVLTSRRQHGYLLFHLAHELGHIAEGHVDCDGEWAIDAEINASDEQEDEVAANRYGFTLLTGDPIFSGMADRATPPKSGQQLALNALSLASSRRIDPLHIALVTAHHYHDFQLGGAALLVLQNNRPDDIAVCRAALARQLDWESLSDDDAVLLQQLTGL